MAAVLRLYALGRQSLWVDEIFTWYSAEVGSRLQIGHLLENVHGPLYSVAVHLSASLFGDREWALRLPSAIAGILTVPAMAWLANRWLGRGTASWAAWFTALSPFLVWYSQEARNYAFLVLFSVVASASLLAARERFTAGSAARWAAASVAAALSNLSFALIAPLHAAWWLTAGRDRGRRVRAALAGLAVLAVVSAPWWPQIARTWDWRRLAPARAAVEGETPLRGETTFHAGAVPFALHAFAVGYTLGPSLRELKSDVRGTLVRHAPLLAVEALVWTALGVAGLAAVARRRRLADTGLWLIAPLALVSYFALQNFKVFHPRYLAIAFPVVLLIASAALADAKRPWRELLAAGAFGLSLLSLAHHYFDPKYGREDYRGALAVVRAEGRPDETILAAGSVDPVEWYARGVMPVERWWLGWASDSVRMHVKLDDALARKAGVWIILSRAEDLDPGDRFATMLDRRFPQAGRRTMPGVRVWHIRRSD